MSQVYTWPPTGNNTLPPNAATASNQVIEIARLTDLDNRLPGGFVPAAFDYVALTYVPSGNGVGQVQTATYKTGGAGGTTVATLTLAYDSSNNLTSVTKT